MNHPFSLPIPSRGVSPYAKVVSQQSADWAQEFGLLASFPQSHSYKMLSIGELVARTHVTFSLDELQLIADWSLWLFINDDLFDRISLDVLEMRIERYLAILNGGDCTSADTSFTHGLANLWQRTCLRVPSTWKTPFIQNMGAHLQSSLWESRMKLSDNVPDVPTYIQMRQRTSGIDAYVDLLAISNRFTLPLVVQYSTSIQRLANMVNNITSWANDIFSASKEIAQGDHKLNMVWLYHHNENISLSEAIERVTSVCQAEIDMFMAQVETLPAFGPAIAQDVTYYVSLLKDIIRGTLDWHFVTDRYRQHWHAAHLSAAP